MIAARPARRCRELRKLKTLEATLESRNRPYAKKTSAATMGQLNVGGRAVLCLKTTVVNGNGVKWSNGQFLYSFVLVVGCSTKLRLETPSVMALLRSSSSRNQLMVSVEA